MKIRYTLEDVMATELVIFYPDTLVGTAIHTFLDKKRSDLILFSGNLSAVDIKQPLSVLLFSHVCLSKFIA